ncbi:hypothetical protein QCB44_09135 [Thiomicrorhabdus sp. zzn3]|uniref:hypothetical protein n=1 Tax=Thiomicrorhabdus sp. zzn3 TaxID=3039775 RepID=UPI002436EDA4|nr:hypothetical protein [Thiomicrorhabdus sp. zzn3]MDG6778869.1 hypothetical protein [Thiomicrorhabdus sp. zzn3]
MSMRSRWIRSAAVSTLATVMAGCSSMQVFSSMPLNPEVKPQIPPSHATVDLVQIFNEADGVSIERARQQLNQQVRLLFSESMPPSSNYSPLERRIRQNVGLSVRDHWILPEQVIMLEKQDGNEVEGRLHVSKTLLVDALQSRLNEINLKLADYRFFSDRGTRLQQLKGFLPALPLIEEYKWLANGLNRLHSSSESSSDSSLAMLMDRRISILFSEFLIMLDEQAPEVEGYQAYLAKALRSQGLQVSSKQPDLILNYYIEVVDENETSQTLLSEITLSEPSKQDFFSFNDETQGALSKNNDGEAPSDEALQLLAEELLQQLTQRLVSLTQAES